MNLAERTNKEWKRFPEIAMKMNHLWERKFMAESKYIDEI